VARSVSPTRSNRLSMRTAARTCVESVRCRPRRLRSPSSRTRSNKVSNNTCAACPRTGFAQKVDFVAHLLLVSWSKHINVTLNFEFLGKAPRTSRVRNSLNTV
jgi:hypothetical protein